MDPADTKALLVASFSINRFGARAIKNVPTYGGGHLLSKITCYDVCYKEFTYLYENVSSIFFHKSILQ